MIFWSSILLLLLLVCVHQCNGDSIINNDDDRVTSIPGYSGDDDELCWSHYAGYLNGAIDGHKLFYWYHEAVSFPEDKPLILWLNGGPGCSSLGGMFTELGPFVVDENMNVTLNPYSFNKVANVLFIEQPVGVGFSSPNGVPANDKTTATDTVVALRCFLKEKHPELQGRPFYVMGESYGGHYVPNTVKEIEESNLREVMQVNIKGFAVGNGYTDWELDFNANVENGRYHALTSSAKFQAAKRACDGEYARCFWPRPDVDCPEECDVAVDAATADARDGSIDIYDIYNDVCLEDEEEQQQIETQITTFERYRRMSKLKARTKHLKGNDDASSSSSRRRDLRATISPIYPTCIDVITARYLNLPEVQEAIHAIKPENGEEPKNWFDCSPTLEYHFNYESELPNYKKWVKDGKLEMLIYNGDADYILSHMGNSAWINEGLKLEVKQEWTKWHGSDGQIAGYYETYDTNHIPFTFLTIKGAGHMVPRDRPRHALDFFTKFIAGGSHYDQVEKSPVTPLCSA